MEPEERKLRELLWLRHGCSLSYLYGDDGEMQCNNTTSHIPIDFLRDTPDEIEGKLRPDAARMAQIVKDFLAKQEQSNEPTDKDN